MPVCRLTRPRPKAPCANTLSKRLRALSIGDFPHLGAALASALRGRLLARLHYRIRTKTKAQKPERGPKTAPAEAGACDLVCTVTASPEPVLQGDWVRPGAHVNLVGAHTLATREADSALIEKSALYVDLMESTVNEGGDIMIPIQEGAIGEDAIAGEIGQLLNADIAGRRDNDQITLYNSLGITAQDLFAARHVYDKAAASGLGVVVDM